VTRTRVIRVGGSLLTWRELPRALRQFVERQPPGRQLLTTGGGPWVDLLRDRAAEWDLDTTDAHWVCIQALGVTAKLLAAVTDYPLYDSLPAWQASPARTAVFDPESFLRSIEPIASGVRLTQNWASSTCERKLGPVAVNRWGLPPHSESTESLVEFRTSRCPHPRTFP
jgi:aspartokinase-like uncharacterized kinase